jgi:ankyrin repeat protein
MDLYEAAHFGKQKVLKELLVAASNVGELDLNSAALQVMYGQGLKAGAKGRVECLRLLLRAGADPNTVDRRQGPGQGSTLLHYAVRYRNVDILNVLIAAGADVTSKDELGNTILDAAGVEGDPAICAALAQAGAVRSAFGTVWQAAYHGDAERVRELLAAGAEPIIGEGRGPLNLAAMNGHVEVCRILLEAGLDVEGTTDDRFTPLMSAAAGGHVEVVRLLLEHGADVKAKWGANTPLKAARGAINVSRERKQALMALLENAGAKVDPAFTAVKELASAAQQPAFQETVQQIASVLGGYSTTWKKRKGVYQFGRFNSAALPQAQADARAAGFCLIRTGAVVQPQETALLFPTSDKYVVVAACGTNTNMGGSDAHDIVLWLRAMEQENPFELTECGFDRLGGVFSGPVINALPLAERMLQFCSDLPGPAEELADELVQTRQFFFWWD